MSKKNQILLIIGVLFMGILITGGSFAYWTWYSDPDKNIVFNTSSELKEYINYDEGESTFVGDFAVSDSYLDGMHSTIAISKKEEVNDITLTATINMDINSIGTNIANSSALKWVVTSGDSSNPGEVLSSGNFLGINSGETMMLLPSVEVTTEVEKYTIWIWLDENENPSSSLTGETLDTVVWTEINQTEGLESVFEITKLTNNYQILNATVVNNTSNVVAYAITTDNVEPLSNNVDAAASPLINKESSSVSLINLDEWIEIPTEEQNKIYNFKYIVSNTGTYYLWFRDANDKVVSNSVTVGEVNTDKPICSWGEFSKGTIVSGELSSINLICTGDIVNGIDLTLDDITLSNNYVTLTNIEKEVVENGYSYTITLTGTEDNGNTTLTLSSGIFMNKYNNVNDSVTSGEVIVANDIDFPRITISSSTASTYQNSQSFKIKMYDNGSGLKAGTYELRYAYGTSTLMACSDIDSTNTVSLTVSEDGTSSVESETITISSGNYSRIYICNTNELVDAKGNIRAVDTLAYQTVRVDNGAPAVGLLASTDRNTYAKSQSFKLRISDGFSGIKAGTYTIKYAVGNSKVECADMTNSVTITVDSDGATGYHYSEEITISSGTTKYIYMCNAEDISDVTGNIRTADTNTGSWWMKIDNGAPALGISASTDRNTYAKSQSFVLRIQDSYSGLPAGTYTLKYATGDSAVACADMTNTTTITVASDGATGYQDSDTITLNTGTTQYIYVCPASSISDLAGNTRSNTSRYYWTLKLDNSGPVGDVTTAVSSSTVNATVNASDDESGVESSYGWKISTSSTCNSTTTGFTTSTNSTYNFTLDESGTYYVCVKVKDNSGNVSYIKSDAIEYSSGLTYEQISTNYSCSNTSVGTSPLFTYTGDCEVVDDGDENWKVRFLTSGTFAATQGMLVDAFLVGGGGGGGSGNGSGGGGGGYTNTTFVNVKANTEYEIVVGIGGAAAEDGDDTTAFGVTTEGGKAATAFSGGNGGSGGGVDGSNAGTNGGKGVRNVNVGGNGQGRTTCEFGEEGCSDNLLYSGGGGGYHASFGSGTGGAGGGGDAVLGIGEAGTENTGGGGGAGLSGGGAGGSGIVVIRNTRNTDTSELPSVGFDFTYTGNYLIINDGNENWRIKFLTSGTFTSSEDMQIDTFLVGGGGGGGYGGGGGGYTYTTFVNIKKNTEYELVIGSGGLTGENGDDTTAFGAIAEGGKAGTSNIGGNGGSGGGGAGNDAGDGGTNGGAGVDGVYAGGTGQGRTTCEFGEEGCSDNLLYSGGGGGYGVSYQGIGGSIGGGDAGLAKGMDGSLNTGGGGGADYENSNAGTGGSGIVIIRNAR